MTDSWPGIPIAILLLPYGLFVCLYLFFVAFNVYHLWRYGTQDVKTQLILFVYLTGTVVIAFGSYTTLARFDWSQTMDLESLFGPLTQTAFPTL